MFHVEHQIEQSSFAKAYHEKVKVIYDNCYEQLELYAGQLLWWNDKVNLVSRDVSRETVMNHIEHSLVVSTSQLFQDARRIIDAGSGGGLPGIPLAITHPEKQVILNDIVSKKMMACKQMVRKLGLKKVSIQEGSITEVEFNKEDVLVSKHAFKINKLMELIGKKDWNRAILLKGSREIEDELEGVGIPLKINIITLDSLGKSFYDGKALVEITKR